ncbi:MAG: AAA family ATPase [Chloroflexota bacterium]|nr:AAA family ATPase [Chloroflexota bacterium]MDE2958955.1 AAA family ATPase [Chloroflexota bacterium]
MDSITLQNYRCFGSEEQTARLAPLTLLVGPNSTGKTSFLALIRALWDVAFREVVPNFREEPFDLGSFEDIVHQKAGRNSAAQHFSGRFELCPPFATSDEMLRFTATFASWQTAPFPIVRAYSDGNVSLELSATKSRDGERSRFRIGQGVWQDVGKEMVMHQSDGLVSLEFLDRLPPVVFGDDDDNLRRFLVGMRVPKMVLPRPFAGAPVRSRPRRTYDPMLLAHDAEGDSIPSYLANVSRRRADEWQLLKGGLEGFGQTSGLFDEISVRSFGKSDGDPFQIQIRKFGKRRKGPWRNLIDVGYGVSQALPVLVEMLRPDAAGMLLLQQPEVHLHPQVQAALGTFFCEVAAGGRQLVVETHSDYIIDRVRMDVRDGTTRLNPEDVSILYFEPGDLDVKIHSIRIDQAGNVLDAPLSYGKFFMAETRRSIGL